MTKVLALLLGCFALASSTKHRRISFGEKVTQQQLMTNFHFIVAILLNCDANDICSGCTGSLIKTDEVLVAAHCLCADGVLIDLNKDVYVYFNSTINGGGREVYGYFGKLNPSFDCSKAFPVRDVVFQGHVDVATIRLEKNITDIRPVTLQKEPIDPEIGQEVVLIGYGKDERNLSIHLKKGLKTLRNCERLPHIEPRVTHVYCTDRSQGTPMTRPGDSGGPLLMPRSDNFYGFVQIGITAGNRNLRTARCNPDGSRVSTDDFVSTFAKLPVHYQWIMFNETSYFSIDVEERKRNRIRRLRKRKRCCSKERVPTTPSP